MKSCSCSVAVYGSEIWTVGESEERVVNGFETWCRGRMLKIKWAHRITNEEDIQRAKGERLFLKILKNRRQSWIRNIIRNSVNSFGTWRWGRMLKKMDR
jgi:hypothetical protein